MIDTNCPAIRRESSKPRRAPRELPMLIAPVALVALASLVGTQPSHAQSATVNSATDTSAPALEEITVTARYKSENLQQAPIAISVVTAADIQARGYVDVADVANSAPNVEMQQNNGVFGRATTAYIRGVGQFDFNYALEPGVAFYLDGVYLGTLISNNIALMDVDNVQVLRGPQGTLSGKNSEGGTISVATVKPKGDGTGYLEAGIGDFSRLTFKGAFDTSLIDDQLFLRVSAASDRYDGYERRIDYVCAHPAESGTLQPVAVAPNCQVGTLGGDSFQTVRAALRWLPASNLEINLSADRSQDNGDATPSTQLALFAPIATGALGSYGLNPNAFIGSNNPYSTYAGFHDVGTGRFIPAVDNSQSWGTAGTIDWDAADGIHVKSITGYRWYGMNWGGQQGGAPVLLAGTYNIVEHNQTSEELQISGHAFDNALDWTGGGYYYHGSSTNGGFVDVAFAGFGFSQNNSAEVTDKSAFLHADYKVGNFGFEAGVRYTKEDKTVNIDELVLPVSDGIPFVPLNSTTENLSRSDPKIGVRYQFTPDVMAYLQYSTGFKAGGANPRPTSPATTGIPFGPEIVKAYEAGLKTEWLDHTLRSNTALFVSNYDDFQATGTVPGANFILIVETNIGKARIYGAEEEIQYEPVRDLKFDLNGGWLHWETLNLGDSANCNCGGPTLTSKPQGVPEYTINAGAQYTFGMGAAGKLTPRLDYNYKAMVWNDAPNTPGNSTPGVGLLDAHLTWTPASHDDWSVIGTLTNATNKFYYTNTLLQPWSLDGVPSPPRMWSVHVRKKF
jgi:iron complex outermembrane recepter protein